MNEGKHGLLISVAVMLLALSLGSVAVAGQVVRPKTAGEHFAAGLELQRAGEHEKALAEYPTRTRPPTSRGR